MLYFHLPSGICLCSRTVFAITFITNFPRFKIRSIVLSSTFCPASWLLFCSIFPGKEYILPSLLAALLLNIPRQRVYSAQPLGCSSAQYSQVESIFCPVSWLLFCSIFPGREYILPSLLAALLLNISRQRVYSAQPLGCSSAQIPR
jgi:hypothetical protein